MYCWKSFDKGLLGFIHTLLCHLIYHLTLPVFHCYNYDRSIKIYQGHENLWISHLVKLKRIATIGL